MSDSVDEAARLAAGTKTGGAVMNSSAVMVDVIGVDRECHSPWKMSVTIGDSSV
jgi:hypothetical protein